MTIIGLYPGIRMRNDLQAEDVVVPLSLLVTRLIGWLGRVVKEKKWHIKTSPWCKRYEDDDDDVDEIIYYTHAINSSCKS